MALDTRKVLTGRDGKLFDAAGNFLAQVPKWQAQINISNQPYQAAGELLEGKVMSSYTVTLTFTETHVEDALLAQVLSEILAGRQPTLNFQGKLDGHNGSTGRYVFRSCVPDGAIDIANVQPGTILERQWNWGVNEPPDMQSLLTAS